VPAEFTTVVELHDIGVSVAPQRRIEVGVIGAEVLPGESLLVGEIRWIEPCWPIEMSSAAVGCAGMVGVSRADAVSPNVSVT
jgi:hypothetical protein